MDGVQYKATAATAAIAPNRPQSSDTRQADSLEKGNKTRQSTTSQKSVANVGCDSVNEVQSGSVWAMPDQDTEDTSSCHLKASHAETWEEAELDEVINRTVREAMQEYEEDAEAENLSQFDLHVVHDEPNNPIRDQSIEDLDQFIGGINLCSSMLTLQPSLTWMDGVVKTQREGHTVNYNPKCDTQTDGVEKWNKGQTKATAFKLPHPLQKEQQKEKSNQSDGVSDLQRAKLLTDCDRGHKEALKHKNKELLEKQDKTEAKLNAVLSANKILAAKLTELQAAKAAEVQYLTVQVHTREKEIGVLTQNLELLKAENTQKIADCTMVANRQIHALTKERDDALRSCADAHKAIEAVNRGECDRCAESGARTAGYKLQADTAQARFEKFHARVMQVMQVAREQQAVLVRCEEELAAAQAQVKALSRLKRKQSAEAETVCQDEDQAWKEVDSQRKNAIEAKEQISNLTQKLKESSADIARVTANAKAQSSELTTQVRSLLQQRAAICRKLKREKKRTLELKDMVQRYEGMNSDLKTQIATTETKANQAQESANKTQGELQQCATVGQKKVALVQQVNKRTSEYETLKAKKNDPKTDYETLSSECQQAMQKGTEMDRRLSKARSEYSANTKELQVPRKEYPEVLNQLQEEKARPPERIIDSENQANQMLKLHHRLSGASTKSAQVQMDQDARLAGSQEFRIEVSRKEQERAMSVDWTGGWLVEALELDGELRSQQPTTRDSEVTELGLASSETQQTHQTESSVEPETPKSSQHNGDSSQRFPAYTLCFLDD